MSGTTGTAADVAAGAAAEGVADRPVDSGPAMRPFHVLFLCTGNSARSILGEALLNHWGGDRFRGFSAGSHPRGDVHPLALDVLRQYRLPTDGLRSKSWDEFAGPDAPPLDFVLTVCDRAAAEVCPIWPGQPMTAHWGLEDPALIEGTEDVKIRAFRKTFRELDARIKIFTSLPFEKLDRLALRRALQDIGTGRSETAEEELDRDSRS